jgi:uncharacterized protein (TIRG00374 family)
LSSASNPAADPARRRRVWQGLLGVAISLVFLYWALRGVAFGDVLREIRAANKLYLALSVVLVTGTFPLRAVRWRLLLAEATGTPPRFTPLWQATAIGFMANNVLPARAGEVARAWAGGRLTGAPMAVALSTIGVERILDGVVVVFLLIVGIFAAGFPADVRVGQAPIENIAFSFGALFAAALLVLMLVVRAPDRALGTSDRLFARFLPARAAAWATGIVRHLFAGLTVLRSPRQTSRVLTWSFAVWLTNAFSYWLAFAAFHLTALPFTAAFVLQGIVALGVAIPSSPGFVGVFELACIAALAIYGVAQEQAAGFAIGVHLAWFVPITVLGLFELWRAGLRFHDMREHKEGA